MLAGLLPCYDAPRPDFFFPRTAMEQFNVAVAFRVVVGSTPIRDIKSVERLNEPLK